MHRSHVQSTFSPLPRQVDILDRSKAIHLIGLNRNKSVNGLHHLRVYDRRTDRKVVPAANEAVFGIISFPQKMQSIPVGLLGIGGEQFQNRKQDC